MSMAYTYTDEIDQLGTNLALVYIKYTIRKAFKIKEKIKVEKLLLSKSDRCRLSLILFYV